MITYTVRDNDTLSGLLLRHGYSRNRIRQLLKYKSLSVNGEVVRHPEMPLSTGDRITVRTSSAGVATDVIRRSGIAIRYEDDAIMVVEKPAGLLTMATESERRNTLYFLLNEYLKAKSPDKGERVFIVHRLDRDTSGLLIFAKSEDVQQRLRNQWKSVEKRYLAVVDGVPGRREGVISGYVSEMSTLKVYVAGETSGARLAVTEYRVLRWGRDHALVEVKLVTGRKHQIRVHLASIDHPVAGDRRYGSRTNPIGRLALHASSITFRHPVTGTVMAFGSRLPAAFTPLLRKMGEEESGSA